MEELQNIRRQGYALDLEEFSEGICCVSAPFLDADGTPAGSFTVALPVARFQRSQRDMVAAVREAGAIATNLLRTGMSGPLTGRTAVAGRRGHGPDRPTAGGWPNQISWSKSKPPRSLTERMKTGRTPCPGAFADGRPVVFQT
jgi:hypothetical protein